MAYKTKDELRKRVKEHYMWAVNEGYEVIGVFLQGSWNYGEYMSDSQSDVDTKCLILPTLEDLALNRKPKSFTHIMENDEHCDVKDVRLYMDCFRKQNVNFVEILFTDYYELNPKYVTIVEELKQKREAIAHYNKIATINCMLGMAYQKQKALCHPYEGLKEKLAKYGYDGKQLSHCLRMKYMLEDYLSNKPYEECLKMNKDRGLYLMAIKRHEPFLNRNALSKDEAIELMDNIVKEMKDMVNEANLENSRDSQVEEILDSFVITCMKMYFKWIFNRKETEI